MLTIENIHLSYNGHLILTNVELNVSQNELLAIIGKEKAGKTSFLEILFGSIKADFQEFSWMNIKCSEGLKKITKTYFSPTEGMMPTYYSIQTLVTVFKGELDELLQFDFFKEIYYTANRLYQFNKSNRLLIEFAILLASNSKIVLLDEPFTHLDQNDKKRLNELLKFYKNNKVILITYSTDIQVCPDTDRYFELSDGHLVVLQKFNET